MNSYTSQILSVLLLLAVLVFLIGGACLFTTSVCTWHTYYLANPTQEELGTLDSLPSKHKLMREVFFKDEVKNYPSE